MVQFPSVRLSLGAFIVLAVGAIAALGLGGGGAHAYGKQDQPLAQIEFSGNCDTPTPGACDLVGGTGGIWLWIEIDANGTGDVAGSTCGHTVGGPGAGAVSIKGEITWEYTTDPFAAGEFFGTFDSSGVYYLVTLPDGEQLVMPTTQGHYSQSFGPGFQLQLQVAP